MQSDENEIVVRNSGFGDQYLELGTGGCSYFTTPPSHPSRRYAMKVTAIHVGHTITWTIVPST